MDIEVATPLLNCFICEEPETPTKIISQVTLKGYPTLLAYAKVLGDATILERMKKAWSIGKLRYHVECKRDMYNKAVKANMESNRKFIKQEIHVVRAYNILLL